MTRENMTFPDAIALVMNQGAEITHQSYGTIHLGSASAQWKDGRTLCIGKEIWRSDGWRVVETPVQAEQRKRMEWACRVLSMVTIGPDSDLGKCILNAAREVPYEQ